MKLPFDKLKGIEINIDGSHPREPIGKCGVLSLRLACISLAKILKQPAASLPDLEIHFRHRWSTLSEPCAPQTTFSCPRVTRSHPDYQMTEVQGTKEIAYDYWVVLTAFADIHNARSARVVLPEDLEANEQAKEVAQIFSLSLEGKALTGHWSRNSLERYQGELSEL